MATDIPERLRAALKMKGVTKAGLAAKAGLHRNTLLGCEDESWNPSLSTLRALQPHLLELEQVEEVA